MTQPNDNQVVAPEVKPAYDILKPEFDARNVLSSKQAAATRQLAVEFLGDADNTVVVFIEMIKKSGVSQVPGLDAMLANIRKRDAGAVGKRVYEATQRMRKVNSQLPKMDPKFMLRFQEQKAKALEILNVVKYISDKIRAAADEYQSMLAIVQRDVDLLTQDQAQSIEAVVRDEKLAKEQDERTEKLLVLCATLEFMKELSAARLKELVELMKTDTSKVLVDEKERIDGLVPLIISRLGSMKPMTHMGKMNEKRFLGQRNANAVVAMKLTDFIEAGVSQWKTDVVSELDAISTLAQAIALQTGVDFMNEQSLAAAGAYAEQVAMANELLKEMFAKVDTMNKVAAVIIATNEAVTKAVEEAVVLHRDVARGIEKDRQEIKSSEDDLSRRLAAALQK